MIAAMALMHYIRKGQFKPPVGLKETVAPTVWNAALSA
jgi:hypothetical protein